MLLAGAFSMVQADRYHEDDGYMVNDNRGDCCPSSCYECACNPLYCGAWDLQVHGGVVPVKWQHRDPLSGIDCLFGTPVVTVFNAIPGFHSFFRVPWTVGGQFGYAWADNVRVYLEFNYVQARAKTNATINTDFIAPGAAAVPVTFNFNKYKLFDGYVGVRYYSNRWCNRTAFFLGGKIGFTHHKGMSSSISVGTPIPATPTVASSPLFGKSTVVSGGANFGLDICFCGNWSVVLTGEVVASCGPHAISNFVVPAAAVATIGYSNFIIGHIGTELRFPVTAGIRYSF